MIYIFATILIVFNGVILLAFKSDGYTLSLYMNLFNVLLLPLLYLIISKREALASVGLNADVKRGAIGTKVLSALKQPIVFIVFAFPLVFELFYFNSTTDRKSTRLNSSHVKISYAVFCLKKKKKRISVLEM